MARPPSDPIKKAQKKFAKLGLGEVTIDNLPKPKKKEQDNSHMQEYRTSVPISRELVPQVDSALDLACERLGFPRELVHGFIKCSPDMSAHILRNPALDNVLVFVSSGVVERLNFDELVYVFGHELGHAIFPHHYKRNSNRRPAGMRQAALSRQIEICMDRFGLVACRDYSSAASACLKLQSGLSALNIQSNIGAYGREAAKGFAVEPTFGDMIASHPDFVVRVRALGLFVETDAYSELTGGSGGKPIDEVNAEVLKNLYDAVDGHALKAEKSIISNACHEMLAFSLLGSPDADIAKRAGQAVQIDAELLKEISLSMQKMPQEKLKEVFGARLSRHAKMAADLCPEVAIHFVTTVKPLVEGTPMSDIVDGYGRLIVRHLEPSDD